MGLAYRELIGSLYESWTIGIERVCKKLINSLIQQCQKCQKWGFEAKEKEGIIRELANLEMREWGGVGS